MKFYPLASFCLAILLGTASAAAQEAASPSSGSASFSVTGLTPEAAGLAIFEEADRRASGYGDLSVDLEMRLRTESGKESSRGLSIRQLEMPGDGDRLLVVFDSPKSYRGAALLSYAHKTEPDDQWIYLPAVKRVKRIASQNKSGPFLSSEFAYEDMALEEVEKFSYRLLESRMEDAGLVHLVERRPTDKHSGYARQVVTLDAAELRILHIQYYDRQDRPLKTLEVSGYELHEGRFWKATDMLMTNQQTGKSTELIWRNYQFGTGLDADRHFSTNSLLRAR